MRPFALPALATALALTLGGTAIADDRPPTDEERAAIEEALRAQGYVGWGDIELDDGRWEVDDATTADGTEYDLELDPGTLQVVRKELD